MELFLAGVQYVSVGLSMDDRMGDDVSMECVPIGGQVQALSSWLTARPNLGARREGVVSLFIKNISFSII